MASTGSTFAGRQRPGLSALDDSEFKFMIPGEPRPSLPVALAGGGQTRDLPVYRHGGGCQCSPGPPAGGRGPSLGGTYCQLLAQ